MMESKKGLTDAEMMVAGSRAAQPQATQAVPYGWWLVPELATREMWDAWDTAPFNEDDDIERNNAWSRLLAAAPSAPQEPARAFGGESAEQAKPAPMRIDVQCRCGRTHHLTMPAGEFSVRISEPGAEG